eukprot:1370747-Prymnesium_polylepis.1
MPLPQPNPKVCAPLLLAKARVIELVLVRIGKVAPRLEIEPEIVEGRDCERCGQSGVGRAVWAERCGQS